MVKRLLKQVGFRLPKEGDDKPVGESSIRQEDLVFFDICSGKGYLSVLLSKQFPKAQVHMIDKMKSTQLDHLKSLSNVEFHRVNIKQPNFLPWMQSKLETPDSQRPKIGTSLLLQHHFIILRYTAIGIALGVHLCGNLSYVLIKAFNGLERVKLMVLAPCCSAKYNPSMKKAKEAKEDIYACWTKELFEAVQSENKLLVVESDVISAKNNFILANKLDQKDSR